MMDRLLCWLGIHGPGWFGNEPHRRSDRTEGFTRKCTVCGAVWHGRQVYYTTHRDIGAWERVE